MRKDDQVRLYLVREREARCNGSRELIRQVYPLDDYSGSQYQRTHHKPVVMMLCWGLRALSAPQSSSALRLEHRFKALRLGTGAFGY